MRRLAGSWFRAWAQDPQRQKRPTIAGAEDQPTIPARFTQTGRQRPDHLWSNGAFLPVPDTGRTSTMMSDQHEFRRAARKSTGRCAADPSPFHSRRSPSSAAKFRSRSDGRSRWTRQDSSEMAHQGLPMMARRQSNRLMPRSTGRSVSRTPVPSRVLTFQALTHDSCRHAEGHPRIHQQ